MNTIQQLQPRFNDPVITPDGPGFLVAKDADGLLLVCIVRETRPRDKSIPNDHGVSPGPHLWYKPEEVQVKQ